MLCNSIRCKDISDTVSLLQISELWKTLKKKKKNIFRLSEYFLTSIPLNIGNPGFYLLFQSKNLRNCGQQHFFYHRSWRQALLSLKINSV